MIIQDRKDMLQTCKEKGKWGLRTHSIKCYFPPLCYSASSESSIWTKWVERFYINCFNYLCGNNNHVNRWLCVYRDLHIVTQTLSRQMIHACARTHTHTHFTSHLFCCLFSLTNLHTHTPHSDLRNRLKKTNTVDFHCAYATHSVTNTYTKCWWCIAPGVWSSEALWQSKL